MDRLLSDHIIPIPAWQEEVKINMQKLFCFMVADGYISTKLFFINIEKLHQSRLDPSGSAQLYPREMADRSVGLITIA